MREEKVRMSIKDLEGKKKKTGFVPRNQSLDCRYRRILGRQLEM
jgi:hypothetical protein